MYKCNGVNMMWKQSLNGTSMECPKCGAMVKLKKGGQFRKHTSKR